MIEELRAINVIKWLEGKAIRPLSIEIIPTQQCNLKCLACEARGKKSYIKEEELTDEQLSDIVDQVIKLRVKNVHFTGGGEPLCRNITIELMSRIKKAGISCSIVTNGTLFKKEDIKALTEQGLNQVVFSIDGPDAKTHDYLRQMPRAFEKATNNVRLFSQKKKKLRLEIPELVIAPVISRHNHIKIEEFVQFVHDCGADSLMIQPMQVKETSLGKQLLLTEENKKEFLVNLTKAKKLAKKLNIRHNIEDIEPELVKKSNDLKELVKHDSEKNVSSNILSIPCFTPWFFMNICANGDVSTCGVHYKAINPDNTKIKTLKEIWKGNYFESVRQQLASKKVPKFCKNCCAMSVISFGRKMREKIVEIEKRRKQGIEATR